MSERKYKDAISCFEEYLKETENIDYEKYVTDRQKYIIDAKLQIARCIICLHDYSQIQKRVNEYLDIADADTDESQQLLCDAEELLETRKIQTLFPFHLIPKGANIALYGAGEAGYTYWKQISQLGYCRIVGIFDRRYEQIQYEGVNVLNPQDMDQYTFDYIIISVIDEESNREIYEMLIESKIPQNKIISCDDYKMKLDS